MNNMFLEIIKEIECILWTIVVPVALYFILKNFVLPIIQQKNERKMKNDAFEREMQWFLIKKDVSLSECQKKKDELQKEFDDFKKKEKESNESNKNKEKEKLEKELLEMKIKAYEEIIKTINK